MSQVNHEKLTSPVGEERARLDLVEKLLATRRPEDGAAAVLAWLGERAQLAGGICAIVREDHLLSLATSGVGADAEEFRVSLADPSHPLVLVLDGEESVEFRGGALRHWPLDDLPFGPDPFLAVPVGRFRSGRAPALLLLTADEFGPLEVERVEWAANLLGTHLTSILYERLEDVRNQGREVLDWHRGVLEAVPDPVLLTDGEGRMLLANQSAEKLFVAEETVSEGRRHAVALNNMMLSASLLPAAEMRDPGRREILLVDPVEGTDLLFEILSTPLPIRPGETGTVSVLRNVSDLHFAVEELEENYRRLREAEAKTRAERDRLDLIIAAVLDPILVTDSKGDTLLMNPPAERIFTVGDEGGRMAERRVMANDAVLSSFLSNLYPGAARRWRGELKLTDPASGRTLPFEAIAGRLEAPTEEDAAVVTILHDLSEAVEKAQLYEQIKRQSEDLQIQIAEATQELEQKNEALQRQAAQLEQASALKSQFLANVSHELRTPLNAMLSWTSLLLEGVYGALGLQHRQKLERVEANGRHLAAIINDVLDISRIEAGKMPVESVEFELPELCREVMREVEPLIDSSRLEVGWSAEEPLPTAMSDRGKVKQILINLLSNALKFTSEGSVRIAVRYDAPLDRMEVAVSDTGIGIAPNLQKLVFEPFGQSAGRTSSRPGAGLGLSICRRLATVLGGEVLLSSVEGEGSTFTLTFPRRLEVE